MDRFTKINELIAEAWQLEQEFLNEQPLEERDRPGTFEHWARKDVATHIETWISRLVENIHKALHGETPYHYADFETANLKVFEMHQAKTWQEAFDFAAQSRRSLIELVKELGAEGLERTDLLPWQDQPIWRNIAADAYNHALIHIGEHYRWLGFPERYASIIQKMAEGSAGLDDSPAWQGGVIYNLACVHALNGDKDQAIAELGEALHLRPDLLEWSQQDSDLESLRGEPAYQALYESQ